MVGTRLRSSCIFGRRHDFKTGLFLEKHNDIRAPKQEITKHVTFFMHASHCDVFLKIAGRHQAQSYGNQCHQSILFRINYYITMSLKELPIY